MKKGKSLSELAGEIERQTNAKRDFVADTREIKIAPKGDDYETWPGTELAVNGSGQFELDNYTHGQIAGHTGIPKKYYDTMLQESPQLLALNVNHWFKEKPKRRMIRTMDNRARAFLSDRYRILDNDEVLESILPVLMDLGGNLQIASCDVTKRKLYLKCLFPGVQAEVKKGDIVEAGFVLSNSEIGAGGVKVDPLIHRLACLNGMIAADYSMKKYHVGRIVGEGKNAIEFFKDDTRKADDQAFLLKLRDTVRAAADETSFKLIVDKMERSTSQKIEGDVPQAVEVVQKKFGMNDGEKHSVLRHLIEGGDLSQYGLMNAITRTSQDIEDYDRATAFESAGGQIIDLKPTEWQEIAQATV